MGGGEERLLNQRQGRQIYNILLNSLQCAKTLCLPHGVPVERQFSSGVHSLPGGGERRGANRQMTIQTCLTLNIPGTIPLGSVSKHALMVPLCGSFVFNVNLLRRRKRQEGRKEGRRTTDLALAWRQYKNKNSMINQHGSCLWHSSSLTLTTKKKKTMTAASVTVVCSCCL